MLLSADGVNWSSGTTITSALLRPLDGKRPNHLVNLQESQTVTGFEETDSCDHIRDHTNTQFQSECAACNMLMECATITRV